MKTEEQIEQKCSTISKELGGFKHKHVIIILGGVIGDIILDISQQAKKPKEEVTKDTLKLLSDCLEFYFEKLDSLELSWEEIENLKYGVEDEINYRA